MHILIVNFGLEGISEEQYQRQVESVAPPSPSCPGSSPRRGWRTRRTTPTAASTPGGVGRRWRLKGGRRLQGDVGQPVPQGCHR